MEYGLRLRSRSSSFFRLLFICLFTQLALINPASGQWSQTNGPEGGSIYDLERVGTNLWAATAYGIYTSGDEGNSWSLHPEFVNVTCNAIVQENANLLVVYNRYNLQRPVYFVRSSSDGGATWNAEHALEENLPGFGDAFMSDGAILVDFGHSQLFRSDDWGATWTAISIEITPDSDYTTMNVNDDHGFLLHNQDAVIDGLFSYNYFDLETMTATHLVTEENLWFEPLLEESTVYYLSIDFDLGITAIKRVGTDGSAVETVYTLDFELGGAAHFASEAGVLYFFATDMDGGVRAVSSLDGGTTWEEITDYPFSPSLPITDKKLTLSNSDLLVGNMSGLARYNSTGTMLSTAANGIKGRLVNYMTANQGVMYCSTFNKVFRSGDAGTTWTPLDLPDGMFGKLIFNGDTVRGMLARENETTELLCTSYDNGVTWQTVAVAGVSSALRPNQSLTEINGDLYLRGYWDLLRSSDQGQTWVTAASTINYDADCLHAINGELYLWSTEIGAVGMYRFNSVTTEFDIVYDSPEDFSTYDVYMRSFGNGVHAMFSRETIVYSTDDGLTWTAAEGNGLPLNNGSTNFPYDIVSVNGTWIGSLTNFGLYSSNDFGNNWSPIEGSTGFYPSFGLTQLNGVLYTGSINGGVWRSDNSSLQTFSGNVYRDYNNNGNKDGNDYDLSNSLVYSVENELAAVTNNAGMYSILTSINGDTLMLQSQLATSTVNPSCYVMNGAASNLDFGLHLDESIHDLSIDLSNINVFRPGFETNFELTVRNNGGSDESPLVKLVIDDGLTFLSSVPPVTTQSGDTLIWQLGAMVFGQTASIAIATIAGQEVQIDDLADCYAFVSPVSNDVTADDNAVEIHDVYVGSYDPNDKTCLQGNQITPEQLTSGQELEYVIRFQNTGTFQADDVRVRDTLSSFLDISTFRLISTSHDVNVTFAGPHIVDFNFNDIFLPDSASNEPLSQGFVKYSIKCKPDITLGDVVENTAYIYFDFNPAIITNTTSTVVSTIILTGDLSSTQPFIVYPNPASSYFTLDYTARSSGKLRLLLTDAKGLVVQNSLLSNPVSTIALTGLSDGLYFGILFDENNSPVGSFRVMAVGK